MRDLDQLEEQDPEERGRRTGTVVMAGVAALVLSGAVFVMVSEAAGAHSKEPDQLDQLDLVAPERSAPTPSDTQTQAATDAKPEPPVDATKLTFEHSLTENEERPEVLAALEAAAREEQALAPRRVDVQATPDRLSVVDDIAPLPSSALRGALPPSAAEPAPLSAAALVEKAARDARAADDDSDERVEMHRNAMPAGVAASSANDELTKAARHDKLVAASLPKQTAAMPRAHVGTEGEFTLQVISFDTPVAAQQFADELRTKGHEAFVAMGDIDGR
ncbi:MAG TPA: hypothetical protein VHZ95_07520, partial [Polyangiales bacterium]|nr:hypothetical protein [Polyangiales bacterium]